MTDPQPPPRPLAVAGHLWRVPDPTAPEVGADQLVCWAVLDGTDTWGCTCSAAGVCAHIAAVWALLGIDPAPDAAPVEEG